MAKLLKILARSVGIILEWLLVFVIVFAFAIRTSPVQTYLAQVATDYLSDELNTTVKIDKVAIVFFDEVALDGFLLLDQSNDTLLAATTIFATLDDYNLSKPSFKVGKVRLDEAYGHLKRDTSGLSNLQFLVDYFKSDKPSSGKKLELAVHTVELNDSRFAYDDARKQPKDFGVSFAHLDVSKINGDFEDISVVGSEVKATIANFTAYEKSGLNLKAFTAQASVGKKGIYLSGVDFTANDSEVHAPKFNLIYNGYDDFAHFVDSVQFDGQLTESLVSMRDVSRFAPALVGMEEMVRIKGNVSNVVNRLSITDLDLRIKNRTRLRGSLKLPNFANMDQLMSHNTIQYAYVDVNELQKIKLPNSSKTRYIKLDKYTNRLGYFEAKDLKLDVRGAQFVVAADRVRTKLGAALLDNGIIFTRYDNYLTFDHSLNSDYDFKVDKFDLGTFLQNKDLGIVDGLFFVSGKAYSPSNINFTKIEGNLNQFDYMGYSYTGIDIKEGTFNDKIFKGKIDVKDDNLDLEYAGTLNFNGAQSFNFTADIGKAVLDRLNVTDVSAKLVAKIVVNLTGTTPENLTGTIEADSLHYYEGLRDVEIPKLLVKVSRGIPVEGKFVDEYKLESNIADAKLVGKVNFDHIVTNLEYQLGRILPAFFSRDVILNETHKEDNFDFDLTVKEADDFLAIFTPNLFIKSGTTVDGKYNGLASNFTLDLLSDSIRYQDYAFSTVNLHQVLDSNSVVATYTVKEFTYKDSLAFHDLTFKTEGGNNQLNSGFTWDGGTSYASAIKWSTAVRDKEHFEFVLDPSYFNLNDTRWDIAQRSIINISKDTISVTDLKIENGKQFLQLNGKISNREEHKMNYAVHDIDLSQLDPFLPKDVRLTGRLNSWGHVAYPNKSLAFIGDAHIMQFNLNENEIGDIFAHSEWDKATESVQLNGDLMYKGFRTFDFKGGYFPNKEENNIAFDLVFEETDIRFTNSFMDPDIINDIEGVLNGELSIGGTLDKPVLSGEIRLDNAKADFKLLGATFGVEGPIEIIEDGFLINGIPIFDEDGNAGSIVGSVYHTNFSDFNFDLLIDLEVEGVSSNPMEPWKREPLDRFLVMNSSYSPNSLYYGKAYVTGDANIFGYSDNLEITVNLQTEKGTDIKFPMYGAGEIEEEYDFITFIQDTSANGKKPERKIDFTGVDLDLHFDVTQNADLQLIFNEELGDIIKAKGDGDIAIRLDNLGDIRMDGSYVVSQGVYDFTMGIIKQPFIIEKGGSIAWTGNPYDAQLDLRTYRMITANIASLSADQFSGGTSAHEEIYCYLDLTETLMKPAIAFDIEAPKANSAGKALIDRVRKDKDELNRQFISLMLAKTFQPLDGGTTASGGAAVDLLENQINALLGKVSSDYKLNVNLDNDNLTGDNLVEFGLQKGFLDDRLILSGSFGVENSKSETSEESSIIGDVNLEYWLNESGTFRVNVFNESNDKSVIQNQQRGHFTQGAGLNYQEDFNGTDDFKAYQTFLDIFRKKGNKRDQNKQRKQQLPVPPKEGELEPTSDD